LKSRERSSSGRLSVFILHEVIQQTDLGPVNARSGGAVGADRLSIVIQKTRQLRMQNTAIKLASRWAVLSLDSSALQPDLSIYLSAYHLSFWLVKNIRGQVLGSEVCQAYDIARFSAYPLS
jgi:hypothetical protein